MEYIEDDLRELKRYYPRLDAIQLQGANPLAPSFDRLKPIFELIQKYFPGVRLLLATRVSDIRNKTVEELRELKKLGLSCVSFGVESGDEWTLQRINKGYHADEIVPLVSKLDEAEIPYWLTFLNGVAGRSHSKEHALHSAEIFSQLHPQMVGTGGLVLFPGTELKEEAEKGEFDELNEKELMEELLLFIENLDCDPEIFITHHTSSMNLSCRNFQEHKAEVVSNLKYGIEHFDMSRLTAVRQNKRTL